MLANVLLASILFGLSAQRSDAQYGEYYCIADKQATDDALIGAMKWACSNGANCTAIQENGTCYLPNTPKDHASYVFNSYYQNMKSRGGSCYFTAAAILTGDDPSHYPCKFEYVNASSPDVPNTKH